MADRTFLTESLVEAEGLLMEWLQLDDQCANPGNVQVELAKRTRKFVCIYGDDEEFGAV